MGQRSVFRPKSLQFRLQKSSSQAYEQYLCPAVYRAHPADYIECDCRNKSMDSSRRFG